MVVNALIDTIQHCYFVRRSFEQAIRVLAFEVLTDRALFVDQLLGVVDEHLLKGRTDTIRYALAYTCLHYVMLYTLMHTVDVLLLPSSSFIACLSCTLTAYSALVRDLCVAY
jgi:hypothetical protein